MVFHLETRKMIITSSKFLSLNKECKRIAFSQLPFYMKKDMGTQDTPFQRTKQGISDYFRKFT